MRVRVSLHCDGVWWVMDGARAWQVEPRVNRGRQNAADDSEKRPWQNQSPTSLASFVSTLTTSPSTQLSLLSN
jgi:hypothetical protein